MNDYRINVEAFEGPLDLLLYLIKKNDLSIADIPISFILDEYVKYLDSLKEMNIDVAGEFLLMAAELAYIKSKMLLPEDGKQEDEDEGDPREDLVRRLLEYQQFKEAAAKISERSQLYRDVFVPMARDRTGEAAEGPAEGMIEADVYELVDAFARILVRLPKEQFHNVAVDRISVNERIMELVDRIKRDISIKLEELFEKPITRYGVVVTFLAILEMAKLKMVKLFQQEKGSPLYLKGIMEEVKQEDMLRLVKSDFEPQVVPEPKEG